MSGKNSVSIRWKYFLLGVSTAAVVVLFLCSDSENTNTEQNSYTGFVSPISIPDSIKFCGEYVPVHYFDVKESLEKELLVNSYWHSNTIGLIQRSSRYFPVIEPILKEYNIPDDFKYLALAESGFTYMVSPAGAAGFWQLVKPTAMEYGLEVNGQVDERYHLEKATSVACSYILESYKKYNDWTMAAASYNAGRRGVDRQIERQKEQNYYDILFNEETARYIFRIVALKLVLEKPENYYFNIPESRRYKPVDYDEVNIETSISNLADFAKEYSTNYKMLKKLNPWLRDNKLSNPSNKKYSIKIPENKARLVK